MRHDKCAAKVWGLATALIIGPCLGTSAQDPIALPNAPARTEEAEITAPSLAAALAAARPPSTGVALTVGADAVARLPNVILPGVQPSVTEIADEYGRIIQRFGGVTTIAPPSMTVLNMDTLVPTNLLDGMPPTTALKLLLGGFDDRQWALVTGDTGIGAADLSDDQQRLFATLFPDGILQVSSTQGGRPITLKADDLREARLRLGQQVQINIPIAGRPNSTFATSVPPLPGQPQYSAALGMTASRDTSFGLRVRDTVPNSLKPSDLDYNAEIWKTPVDPSGAKTVGELVTRIGAATGTEIYADRRYEGRSLTLLGHGPVATGDLLHALAFCVSGAYRQVGTAFVLSNDRVGLVVRRALLDRIPQEAGKLQAGAMADAEDRLFTVRGGTAKLPSREDTGLTDAQKALSPPPNDSQFPANQINLGLTWAQLTPPQQELVRREADLIQRQQALMKSTENPITLDGTFQVSTQPAFELLSPAVSGPIKLGGMLWGPFEPSNAYRTAAWRRSLKTMPPAVRVRVTKSTPPLVALFARYSRRAVIAHPQSAEDVAALVADMKRLGLNQLWLDVFSDGRSHLGEKDAILTAALAQTKGTGIFVVPTLSLLLWETDAPDEAADRTLLGETSAQTETRHNHEEDIRTGRTSTDIDTTPPVTTLSVCPMAESVRETLVALVRKLAATPGIAALALRDTVTSGYENDRGSSTGDELGYATPTRLAFLRRWHVDPTDPLTTGKQFYGPDRPDTSIPEFEAATPSGPDLSGDWNDFRRAADLDLMQHLLAAARSPTRQQLPLLVKERGTHWIQEWYGLWADPRAPLPTMPQAAIFNPPGNDNFAPLAHSQSRVNVLILPAWSGQSRDDLANTLLKLKPGWDGIVLDVSDHPGGDALSGLLGSPVREDGDVASRNPSP